MENIFSVRIGGAWKVLLAVFSLFYAGWTYDYWEGKKGRSGAGAPSVKREIRPRGCGRWRGRRVKEDDDYDGDGGGVKSTYEARLRRIATSSPEDRKTCASGATGEGGWFGL
ncbi:hypothetical protein GWI33_002886 [Rhynchophorus ferrugineus]|uniref:Uncharacterized protein n=1 Tax=Rhynchophorus ferrugineus TaxID=354439 RepID=A0A834IYB3_RHYFE|nr:hypothetical protein GWI33_002886 [Rhynchophorus ferrugineus]